MVLLSAIACSIGRVTSCSTCSAVAPGQGHCAEATRTGMSGSLRFGMWWYPYQPHTNTASKSTEAICRCSVKNRAVLCVPAMYSASDLWTCAIFFCHPEQRFSCAARDLLNHANGFAILDHG